MVRRRSCSSFGTKPWNATRAAAGRQASSSSPADRGLSRPPPGHRYEPAFGPSLPEPAAGVGSVVHLAVRWRSRDPESPPECLGNSGGYPRAPFRTTPSISERRKPLQRAREIKAGFRPFRRRSDQDPPLSPQTRDPRTPAKTRQQGSSAWSLDGSACKQTGRPRERPTG